MSIIIDNQSREDLLHIKMSGKLHKEDYERFLPDVERLIEAQGKINLLVEMHDFHGWDLPSLWEDLKFDAKHFNDVRRLAMVGDQAWEKWMSIFCKPFTTAKVRYFTPDQLAEARQWVAAAGE